MMDFSVFTQLNDQQEGLIIQCSLDERFSPPAGILSFEGILDHSNTIEFAEAVMEFFGGEWEEHPLILDLSGLQYISSSGIGSFTTIRVQADHKSSPLYLLNMNTKIRTVFDQLGFSSFFEIIDDLQEILA